MPVTVPIRKFCVIFCTYLALKEAKMNASINNSKRFLFLIFNSLHKMHDKSRAAIKTIIYIMFK